MNLLCPIAILAAGAVALKALLAVGWRYIAAAPDARPDPVDEQYATTPAGQDQVVLEVLAELQASLDLPADLYLIPEQRSA